MNKNLRVSIVIPVYNEAPHLGACLQAIAAQRIAPLEVIVVDNNSSDNSVAIAEQFPFVRLIRERRQGVVHARSTGFDAASGDIIGRIDADTLLPDDWVLQLQAIFRDDSIAAVSGAVDYYDFALADIANGVDQWCRRYLSNRLGDQNFLFGANMAVRRQAWKDVRSSLCAQRSLHEDFDLAIHLQQHGHQVVYSSVLVAGVSVRRIDSDLMSFVRYSLVSPRTYAWHGLSGRRHMYPVLVVIWATYLPARLVYRSIDPRTGNFSWQRLFNLAAVRIDPTTNVA